jgi:signal transduction histidine kinase
LKPKLIQILSKLATEYNLFHQKALRNILIVSVILATVLPAYMILFIYPSFSGLLTGSAEKSALRAATHLKSMHFLETAELSKETLDAGFLNAVENIKNDMHLIKVKVFSPSGEIIFSSDPAEIGDFNKQIYFRESVARGEIYTRIIQKNTESLEGQILKSDVVETYVPIMRGDSFLGALEIYYDITASKDELDQLLAHSSIILLTLSFGFLFVVIRILLRENLTIMGRKRAEEALQKAHHDLKATSTQLKEANAELLQYARVVSHDLQAPLRASSNYIGFLREDLESVLKGENKVYLDALDRTVEEATEMIKDMLEVSRVGRGAATLDDVHTGAFLRTLIDSSQLTDDVQFKMPEDWPTITADPLLLRQVFQNLIENAVKFNDTSDIRVELGWRQKTDTHYEFFVRDNGIGIDKRYYEKIFRMLERLHTRKEYRGTGIGLAIVKKAVIKLGGAIRVESRPGRGSTFYVILPVTQEPRLI